MIKISLITTKYPTLSGNEWLTNELAECFAKRGCHVSVIALSWEFDDGPTECILINGVSVNRLRLWKIFYKKSLIFSSLKIILFPIVARFKYSEIVQSSRIVIATTPCITLYAFAVFFKTIKAKKYLIAWDFFPYYMSGFWTGWKKLAFHPMLFFERAVMSRFDSIGCMTKQAVEFAREKYDLVGSNIHILPLWTKQLAMPKLSIAERVSVRLKYGIEQGSFVSIYGGAMSAVQGLDQLIELARVASVNEELFFVFVGRGPYLDHLKAIVGDYSLRNVKFIDQVSRIEYERLVASSDVGLVSLSSKHSVPSFPSKTIDYLKVGLPILAAVDSTTAYAEILQNDIRAGIAVNTGLVSDLYSALSYMHSDSAFLSNCSLNGREYYEKNLDVNLAVNSIMKNCEIYEIN